MNLLFFHLNQVLYMIKHIQLIGPYSTNNQLVQQNLFREECNIKHTLKIGLMLVSNTQPDKYFPFVFSSEFFFLCLEKKKTTTSKHQTKNKQTTKTTTKPTKPTTNQQKKTIKSFWALRSVASPVTSALLVIDIASVCKPWLVHYLKQMWIVISSNSIACFDDSFRGC